MAGASLLIQAGARLSPRQSPWLAGVADSGLWKGIVANPNPNRNPLSHIDIQFSSADHLSMVKYDKALQSIWQP